MQRLSVEAEHAGIKAERKLRVLLVPDSVHWITGTIARSIVEHNEWLDGTIISGHVLDIIARNDSSLFNAFDIVHFVCPYASRAWLPRLHDRLPCVTSHHHVSDDWELQRHNLSGDAIIVGSRQWADDVVERGAAPEQVVCVPYGVDAKRFVPATALERDAIRNELGISLSAIVVGFFAKKSSNERDRKGTDIFSAAIRELSDALPEAAVLIIGPGWDELVAGLIAAGVTCVWKPFIRDASDMPRMFQALDFYWVTARVEGGPVTLLEAMSAGLCCLSTPVGLAKEIVKSGSNGLLVPFDNADAFAKATARYARMPEERKTLGARARQTILETMDVPVTAQAVRHAYDAAIRRFASRRPAAAQGLANLTAAPSKTTGALPPATLARVAMLEQLVWAEALMLQGQRPLAFRLIVETWTEHPFSTLPFRFFLRNALPKGMVRALVRAKLHLATAV